MPPFTIRSVFSLLFNHSEEAMAIHILIMKTVMTKTEMKMTKTEIIIILEQLSMVHHRKYPLFYLLPLPWGQGHTKCSSVPST